MKYTLASILILLALSLIGCSLFPAKQSVNQNSHIAPQDWRLYDTGHGVCFYAPAYVKQITHIGLQTDSDGAEFIANNMQIVTDYGFYSNKLETYKNSSSYQEEEIIINDKKGKICTFRVNNASESYLGADTMRYIAAAYFPGNNGDRSLLIWISCRGEDDQSIAKSIIKTIAFKTR